jgi:nucleoside-diphosphate-sugar epimerase
MYAVQKRLQEEMCRQFHDAHGWPWAVLPFTRALFYCISVSPYKI